MKKLDALMPIESVKPLAISARSTKWFYIARERMDHHYTISATKMAPVSNGMWFSSKSLRHQFSDITVAIMGLKFKEGHQYQARIVFKTKK